MMDLTPGKISYVMDQFLKLNFTGPSKKVASSSSDLEKLKIDGLRPNKLTQGAGLLVEALDHPQSAVENARALVLQQSLLDGPSSTLKKDIFGLYGKSEGPTIELERARAHLIYNELEECQECLARAQKAQNFTWTVTGVKGKRTQFQERDATQLVALAKSSQVPEGAPTQEACVPSREHNSKTLLEHPVYTGELPDEFKDLDANTPTALNNLDVALMLLQAEYLLRANPARDAAINEQVVAIAERVIASPHVDWLLHLRALWLRSCVESHFEARAIETLTRGTLQMADIVNALHQTQEVEGQSRLEYAHLVMPLPKWSIDTELAKRLVQIGGVQASAEIYDRLEMPVDAAVCYAAGGENVKALDRINAFLASNPHDGRAWSIKGDLTQDPECWIKAWESSKYLTAKVSLGKYYQQRGDLNEAAKHLEEAIKANSQIMDTQFTLGCIKLQLKDFNGAERAFTECIKIQPDEAKCWINLGAVRAQLGKLEQALMAFERALQVDQNHEPNMRVWNNKMLLACELRKWQTVVDGYKYMLGSDFDQDLYLNPSILTEMTAAFTMQPFSGTALETSFAQLMCDQLPKKLASEANIWRLAATVSEWQNKPWDALKQYENGWQTVLEQPENTALAFRKLTKWTHVLVEAYQRLGSKEGRIEGSKVSPEAPIKARNAVKQALARGDAFKGTEEYRMLESLF